MILRRIVLFIIIFLGMGIGNSFSQTQIVLNLEQSIKIALQHNKTLAASAEKLKEAKARLGEARTGFLPKLKGTANYTKLDVAPFMPGKVFGNAMPSIPGMPQMNLPKRITIGRDEMVGIGVQLQQPIFTGFSILNGFRMAKDGIKATEAEYSKNKDDLIFNVQKAYWGVVKAQKFVEVAREAVKQVEGHVKDLENMYNVGMVTKNDLLKAKVQLSNAKLGLIQAKNGLELAKKSFCNVLGIPLDTDVKLTEELSYKPSANISLSDAVSQALLQRPEISMLKAGISIGKRTVNIASAGYLPNFTLVLDYGYKKPNREYNMEFYTTWTVSLVASMNLFDWGRTHYKRTQAQHQLLQMKENFENAKNGIRLEVTQAVLMEKTAEQKIRVAEENVKQAEENFRVTADLFQQGMATNTDYLDANTLLVKAKTDYISALIDYKLAEAQLKRAMGIIGKGE